MGRLCSVLLTWFSSQKLSGVVISEGTKNKKDASSQTILFWFFNVRVPLVRHEFEVYKLNLGWVKIKYLD